MKKFKVQLTREYLVEINAKNEDAAIEFTELYISGGMDDSREDTRLKGNFQILQIKPVTNDALVLDEI